MYYRINLGMDVPFYPSTLPLSSTIVDPTIVTLHMETASTLCSTFIFQPLDQLQTSMVPTTRVWNRLLPSDMLIFLILPTSS